MKVSAIVPAYNEESSVGYVIGKLKKVELINEIIVVDDGSSDETSRVAELEGVKVIKHRVNKGKGAAIRTALGKTDAGIVLFMDADTRRIDVKKIKLMINKIKSGKADVVIGTFKFGVYQTFTEVVYKPLMNLLFPEVMLKIKRGHLSGQRAFRRRILDRISIKDGFDFESAMNIELCFLKPSPKIDFVYLGDLNSRPKGYQTSMGVIADSILDYAKKYHRLKRLRNSSFSRVTKLLYDSVKNC